MADRLPGIQAGNLDLALVPNGEIEAAIAAYGQSGDGYSASPKHQVLLGPELATSYLIVNLQDPVLRNADVRRALSLALDRAAVCQVVYGDSGDSATSIIPGGILGYEPGAWAFAHYDTAEAARLLQQAGYPHGQGLPELTLPYTSDTEQLCVLLQAQFKVVGVRLKIETLDFAALVDRMAQKNFQLLPLGWVADYPTIDNFLYPLFTSGSPDDASGYSDPAVDDAILAARTLTDQDQRIAAYQAIVRTIGDASPIIPIASFKHRVVVADRVRGLTYGPGCSINYATCWIAAQ